MENSLFSNARLEQLCEVMPTPEQTRIINEWSSMVQAGALKGEVENYLEFTFKILHRLLGYDESDIAFEKKHGSGRVEFSIRDVGQPDTFRAIIEVKGSDIDLDNIVKTGGKIERSAVEQAFSYAINARGTQWIIVTNYGETRIYNYYKKKKYISFSVVELEKPEILRIFLGLLSKENFLSKRIADSALKETLAIEQHFTNDFYQLYHVTRLEILRQIKQTTKLELPKIIHVTQTLLNRIIFIAYASSCRLLPAEILTKVMVEPINSKDVAANRSEIWHKLNLLFVDVDKGRDDKKINEYNGTLFKEKLDVILDKDGATVTFNDLLEKEDKENVAYKHPFDYNELKDLLGDYANKLNPIFKNFLLMTRINYREEVTVDIFGHVFEQSVVDIERLHKEGIDKILAEVTEKRDRKDGKSTRKKEGIFYTPEMVTSEITRSTIVSYLAQVPGVFTIEQLLEEYVKNPEAIEKRLREIKIIDIACGSGAFLCQSIEFLSELTEKIYKYKKDYNIAKKGTLDAHFDAFRIKNQISINNLFGADISESAIEIAQLSLFLKLANEKYHLPDLAQNFSCGNSVIDDEKFTPAPIHWNQEYDVIIMNPPYIPLEKINETEREYFANHYSVYRTYDTSILFIEKAIGLLKPNGVLGVIAPLTWQTGENHQNFRDAIFSKARILKIINLPFDIFPEAYVDTGITIFKKTDNLAGNGEVFQAFAFDKKADVATLHVDKWEFIPWKTVLAQEKKCVYLSNFAYKLRDRLEAFNKKPNFKPLGEITESRMGKTKNQHDRHPKLQGPTDIPFYEKGKSNRHYLIINEVSYIDVAAIPNMEPFFTRPRMLVRRIISRLDRMMAFYIEQKLGTSKDYNPFLLKTEDGWDKKINYRYLTALLNSKVLSFFYINFSTVALKDDFRSTTLENVRELPICIAPPKSQEDLAHDQAELEKYWLSFENEKITAGDALVAKFSKKIKKARTKLYNLHSWGEGDLENVFGKLTLPEVEELNKYIKDKQKLLADIIEKIKLLEKQIDMKVYTLYELTPEEIQIIEGRFPSDYRIETESE